MSALTSLEGAGSWQTSRLAHFRGWSCLSSCPDLFEDNEDEWASLESVFSLVNILNPVSEVVPVGKVPSMFLVGLSMTVVLCWRGDCHLSVWAMPRAHLLGISATLSLLCLINVALYVTFLVFWYQLTGFLRLLLDKHVQAAGCRQGNVPAPCKNKGPILPFISKKITYHWVLLAPK